ncbi:MULTISPECIES: hypothetical protein [unclassified Streptomyces]|uniref:hypothetical protein n=1 Tax=unclassified Streptomyces TaxID=2593676 RepID=UPI00225A8E8A|nr:MULTISPECIES: hypothetical protein [unclassified Streptomyces]WSP56981.1 hypothetical protein OG306_23355 [Streptomyces sp. NBC_01241]WSU22302.1 hypothetical protein OG508_15870 [Streptomyces sp. NBC_01108]MCX4788771.1 hypothetical protein [Streptomyces sp. NBC_01221]MCX4795481.1 hypothetical protein [Streptomyces sp. NBC_01242]WSJ36775.1 hypothetical protein OG772_12485 [Streptomyces sp. NBC_01321]
MSQPVPPPHQPNDAQPVDGNPYVGQQPGPYGQPGATFDAAPFAPAAPTRNNLGLGLLTAVVTAVVAAFLYGVIAGAIDREIGYIAVGVGFLVGFATSKVGGQNPVLPVVSAVLSVGAVYLGQLVGVAIALSDLVHQSASSLFFDHFDVLTKAWNAGSDFKTYLFLLLAAVAAIGGAKKAA